MRNNKQTALTCLSIRIILVSSSISNSSSLSGAWLSNMPNLNDVSNDSLWTHWTWFMKIELIRMRTHLSVDDTGSSPWRPVSSHFLDLTCENCSPMRNTLKILLLIYWSLRITRHLAMVATGQTLVWWSSEIWPTPHKTNHKIWNQKKWKCHFCHCQLMYHKSLWYLHNLPLARV